MWLSKKTRPAAPTTDADLGVTTISGGSVGVLTRGEVRSLPIYGPGGYAWMPDNGAAVLVIKGGPGGREQCVAGMRQTPPADLAPGEVAVQGPGGSVIRLRSDGTVEICGDSVKIQGDRVDIQGWLMINGKEYKPCTCAEGGSLG